MMPTVEQLAAKGYPVRRMNVAQYRNLVQRFGITTIPCFVMIVNGREAGRVVGRRASAACSSSAAWDVPRPQPRRHAGNASAAAPAASFNPDGAPACGSRRGERAPNVPVIPVVYAAAPQPPPASDAAMLAAGVRLRVEDPQGHSCGSGTIIDARAGSEALVLTCGHLFRDSKGTGKIDVDVSVPRRPSACRAGWWPTTWNATSAWWPSARRGP